MLTNLKNYLYLFLAQVQFLFSPNEGAIDHKGLNEMSWCGILVFDKVPGEDMYYERFSPNVLYHGEMLRLCIREFMKTVNRSEAFPSDTVKSVLIRKLASNDNNYLKPIYHLKFTDSVLYTNPIIPNELCQVIVLSVHGPSNVIDDFSKMTFVPRFKGKQMTRYFKPEKLVAIDNEHLV